MPLDIIHEDAALIVIDKPAGLVVHPDAGNRDGTLVNGLLARYPEIASVGDPERPGIVHRLDKGTSGLLVVARSERAYDSLVGQLSDIEAKERGCGLGDAEYVSRRENDPILHAAPRDHGRIMPIRQAAPEIESAAGYDPGNEAKRRQPVYRLLPGSRQAPAYLIHVLAIAAAGQNACDQLGRSRARTTKARGNLKID